MSFLSNIFGGNTQVQPAQINYPGPGGFNSGGTTAYYNPSSGYNVNSTPTLSNLIGNVQSTFQNESQAFGKLAGTVQPGFSQLRRAGLNQINTQQQSSVSNLRDTLAQRRILGSSFGQNQITQANADFAQDRANFVANSYLQELNASNQLIQEQYGAAVNSYTAGINQLNLNTDVAARLTQSASQVMGQVAISQARLDQEAATTNAQNQIASEQGLGKLFGTIFSSGTNTLGGQALGSLGSTLGNIFSSASWNAALPATETLVGL